MTFLQTSTFVTFLFFSNLHQYDFSLKQNAKKSHFGANFFSLLSPAEALEGSHWHFKTALCIFSILGFQVWPPPSLPWGSFSSPKKKKL